MTAEQIAALTRQEFHRMAAELKPETRMFIDGSSSRQNPPSNLKRSTRPKTKSLRACHLVDPKTSISLSHRPAKHLSRASGQGWNRVHGPRLCIVSLI